MRGFAFTGGHAVDLFCCGQRSHFDVMLDGAFRSS